MDMHLNPCKPGKRPMIQRVTDRLATQSRGLRFVQEILIKMMAK